MMKKPGHWEGVERLPLEVDFYSAFFRRTFVPHFNKVWHFP
jgi:hypothetical protein